MFLVGLWLHLLEDDSALILRIDRKAHLLLRWCENLDTTPDRTEDGKNNGPAFCDLELRGGESSE